jgi:phospholipid/cholesterol/gamma-HCH transport system substrate-binding protein
MEKKRTLNNIRLGAFVLAAAVLLMCLLYYVGRNENKWASGVEVVVHFSQLGGLQEGNNVLYAGMPAGSVKAIRILDDTTIEVSLLINKKTSRFIHRNALVHIGSEGLMGNKVVNINAQPGNYPLIAEGDLLSSEEMAGFDKVVPRMVKIGDNVSTLSSMLLKTALELDTSALLGLLKNRRTAALIVQSLVKLNNTADNIAAASADVRIMMDGIRNGNGTIGQLLRDTMIMSELRITAGTLKTTAGDLKTAAAGIDEMSDTLKDKLTHGSGLFNLLLTDTAAAGNLRASLWNIRRGTDNFNQDMLALQHNFLLRGYFRRKAKDSTATRP